MAKFNSDFAFLAFWKFSGEIAHFAGNKQLALIRAQTNGGKAEDFVVVEVPNDRDSRGLYHQATYGNFLLKDAIAEGFKVAHQN